MTEFSFTENNIEYNVLIHEGHVIEASKRVADQWLDLDPETWLDNRNKEMGYPDVPPCCDECAGQKRRR